MDERTKVLVQSSWEQVRPISDKAAELFYDRLFKLDPTLQFLFKSPIPVQGKLLMDALDRAVTGLDDLDALVPIVEDLGARHARYGVAETDYDTVGEAFLWTLEQGLGDDFTDEVKAAWVEVYGVLSTVMKDAQADESSPGPVTPREKRLVQGSWQKVVPIADTAAEIFYAKLFELDPALKSLFTSDMTAQGKKLMQMLTVAVNGLDRMEEIVPAVQALGRRHVTYGVEDKDYDTVGEAFVYTLGKGLGDDFTDEVKAAWLSVYGVVARAMKDAAATEQRPSPPNAREAAGGDSGAGMIFLGLVMAAIVIVGWL